MGNSRWGSLLIAVQYGDERRGRASASARAAALRVGRCDATRVRGGVRDSEDATLVPDSNFRASFEVSRPRLTITAHIANDSVPEEDNAELRTWWWWFESEKRVDDASDGGQENFTKQRSGGAKV